MNCELVRRHLDAFVDGELDAGTQIEFDMHLAGCEACGRVRDFEHAFRARMKESLGHVRAPEHLRARIAENLSQLRAEAEREESTGPWRDARSRSVRRRRWYAAASVPLAAAAATFLVLYVRGSSAGGGNPIEQASMLPMLEDVVRLHASGLPADVTSDAPENVRTYFRNKVGFPVRPAVFVQQPSKLVGARLSNVLDRRAAALYYDVGGRRVTMVIFDGDGTAQAEHERLDGHEVYYRRVGGYTVPLIRDDGITYAFTGDMDGRSLLRLAATAQVGR